MSDKRIHGLDAVVGDAGSVRSTDILGPCPSCGAPVSAGPAKDPRTGKVVRALMHPFPFCTYYGETDCHVMERDIERAQKEN